MTHRWQYYRHPSGQVLVRSDEPAVLCNVKWRIILDILEHSPHVSGRKMGQKWADLPLYMIRLHPASASVMERMVKVIS